MVSIPQKIKSSKRKVKGKSYRFKETYLYTYMCVRYIYTQQLGKPGVTWEIRSNHRFKANLNNLVKPCSKIKREIGQGARNITH